MLLLGLFLIALRAQAFPSGNPTETDSEESRKILGSSVVTSVSVILNTANGTQIIDAVGKPVPHPLTGTYVASPINLLNPDRYEFFTFDDNGELVKRLMTLQEIQSIIANGDGEDLNYNTGNYLPENKVDDVVSNVQNVLKEQMASHKNMTDLKPMLDTPDVSSTWSMILPAIFSNNADGVTAEKPALAVTADTFVVEDVVTEKSNEVSEIVTTERFTPTTAKSTTTSEIVQTATPVVTTTTMRVTTTTTPRAVPTTTTTTPSAPTTTTTTTPSAPTTTTTTTTTPSAPTTTTTPVPTKTPVPTTTTTTTTTPIPTTITTTSTTTTTPIPSTTITTTPTPTKATSMPPITIPTTTLAPITTPMLEKLTTEQHVDTTTQPDSTILEDTKESTPPSDENDDIITVTIISDAEYDISTLPVGGDSPIVSISSIQVKTSTESSSEGILIDDNSSTSSILADLEDIKATEAVPMLTTTMEPVKIQAYAPISEPIRAPVYVMHKETISSTEVIPILQNEIVKDEVVLKDEVTTSKPEELSEKVPQSDEEEIRTEETKLNLEISSESSSDELINTSASSSVGPSKSTTPILLIIKERPVTEKIQSENLSDILSEDESSESVISNEGEPTKTTPLPLKVTDKLNTIKIIYLTDKTVANILSSTIQPSSTTPKSISIVPEEIATITKLIATTDAPNTVEIIPLTEKLITTISSISLPTAIPITTSTNEEVQSTVVVQKENEEEIIPEFTTETSTTIYNDAVTESLNQLLLTSTNIYEINTQLAGNTGMDQDTETILELDEDLQTQSDTTTESYTTELSLMSSIQQLISQTVDNTNIEDQIVNLESSQKVEEFLANMDSKPMLDVQNEAVTMGSTVLTGGNNEEITTNGESEDVGVTESDESLKLSEAVSSVLSQIYMQSENIGSELDKVITNNEEGKKNETSLEAENIAAESSQKIITEITGNDHESIDIKESEEGLLKQNEDIIPQVEGNGTLSGESSKLDQVDEDNLDKTTMVPTTHVEGIKNKITEIEEIPNVIKIVLLNSEKANTHKRRRKPLRTTTEVPTIMEELSNIDNNKETGIVITQTSEDERLQTTTISAMNIQELVDQNKNKEEETVTETINIKGEDTQLEESSKTEGDLQNDNDAKIDISTEGKEKISGSDLATETEEIFNIEEKLKPFEIAESSTKTDLNVSSMDTENTTYSAATSAVLIETSSQPNDENDKIEETQQPIKKIKIDDEMEGLQGAESTPSHSPSVPSESSDQPLKVDLGEDKNTSWTLVSTILPHANTTVQEEPASIVTTTTTTQVPVKLSQQSLPGFGLEDTTSKLDTDIYQFVELCNELSFGFWNAVTHGISSARSVFVSPFAATSLLAMVFLGARGATSGEMNEILKLDDMVTFNPHLIFKNVSESIEISQTSGVAVSVIARELYSDKGRGKLLSFYKERAKQFYDGHVEEINFKEVGDVVRRRTNLIVKKNSFGKIAEYLKDNSITMRPPLAGISASIFQTDCSSASTEGRDGELHFVVLPSIRQRRLIPVPAVVFRGGFLAGYDPTLDATAAAIGTQEQIVSTILVIPGQQGIAAPGDGLARLEKQLTEGAFKKGTWIRLLRTLIPRPGLELQIPRFSHKSVINATIALQKMGLKDLFHYGKADLRGLNGAAQELHLSDVLQLNNFATCGESPINFEQHHSEIYPATSRRPYRRTRKLGHYISDSVFSDIIDEPRDYQRAFHDPLHDPTLLSLPLPLRPRQARIPDAPRLRFDRPFLFYVRHNPSGLILHMGRFNPRLLP